MPVSLARHGRRSGRHVRCSLRDACSTRRPAHRHTARSGRGGGRRAGRDRPCVRGLRGGNQHAHRSRAPRLGRLLRDPRARAPGDQVRLGRSGLVRRHLATLAAHPHRHRHRAAPAPDRVRRPRQRHRRADLRADDRRRAGDTHQRGHLVPPGGRERHGADDAVGHLHGRHGRGRGRLPLRRGRHRHDARAPTGRWPRPGSGADEIDIASDPDEPRGRSRQRRRLLEPGQGRPVSRSTCPRSPEMGLAIDVSAGSATADLAARGCPA